MNNKMILRMAKIAHTNNSIWSKMKEGTITDFTCAWADLTEYQMELYIAGIEIMIVTYRLSYSPIRWFWNFYYKHCKGGF